MGSVAVFYMLPGVLGVMQQGVCLRLAKPELHVFLSYLESSYVHSGPRVKRLEVLVACSCASQTCRKKLSKQARMSSKEFHSVGKSGFITLK